MSSLCNPREAQPPQQGAASTTSLMVPNLIAAGETSSSGTFSATPRTGSTQDTTSSQSRNDSSPIGNPASGLSPALPDRPHGQNSIYSLHRPSPPRPQCKLFITRAKFMEKGVETARRGPCVDRQCPICLLVFEREEESAARAMLTVRRCGCHFHRECLEQCLGQWCPCCRLKWWRRPLGTWLADFTRPDEMVGAGRPGRAFAAPRRG